MPLCLFSHYIYKYILQYLSSYFNLLNCFHAKIKLKQNIGTLRRIRRKNCDEFVAKEKLKLRRIRHCFCDEFVTVFATNSSQTNFFNWRFIFQIKMTLFLFSHYIYKYILQYLSNYFNLLNCFHAKIQLKWLQAPCDELKNSDEFVTKLKLRRIRRKLKLRPTGRNHLGFQPAITDKNISSFCILNF